jgi:hypothetical protein
MYRSISFLICRFCPIAKKNGDARDVPAAQESEKQISIRHFGNAIPDARFSEHDRWIFRIFLDLLP